MEVVIEIENLTKSYGNKKILENISLEIEEGKIYGLLGRNGAGKTTLLNIISDRIFKDSGEVKVFGEETYENKKVLEKIYFMSENLYMIQSMSVKEFFKWMKIFYKNFDYNYAKILAEKFELSLNKKFGNLSTGYKTIYKIIGALASNSEIVIYDEPVLGLDVHHRELFYKELLKNYEKNENTIIISTHLIEEVSGILEKVIMIEKGRMLLNSNVEDLLEKTFKVSGSKETVLEVIRGKKILSEESFNGRYSIIVFSEERIKSCSYVKIEKINLQELYLNITRK